MAKEPLFTITTFTVKLKKGIPVLHPLVQKIKSESDLEKALQKIEKSTILRFELINTQSNTKTLFNRLLGAKNFSKKTVPL